jgi:hypothetical protein
VDFHLVVEETVDTVVVLLMGVVEVVILEDLEAMPHREAEEDLVGPLLPELPLPLQAWILLPLLRSLSPTLLLFLLRPNSSLLPPLELIQRLFHAEWLVWTSLSLVEQEVVEIPQPHLEEKAIRSAEPFPLILKIISRSRSVLMVEQLIALEQEEVVQEKEESAVVEVGVKVVEVVVPKFSTTRLPALSWSLEVVEELLSFLLEEMLDWPLVRPEGELAPEQEVLKLQLVLSTDQEWTEEVLVLSEVAAEAVVTSAEELVGLLVLALVTLEVELPVLFLQQPPESLQDSILPPLLRSSWPTILPRRLSCSHLPLPDLTLSLFLLVSLV